MHFLFSFFISFYNNKRTSFYPSPNEGKIFEQTKPNQTKNTLNKKSDPADTSKTC